MDRPQLVLVRLIMLAERMFTRVLDIKNCVFYFHNEKK